MSMKNSFFSLFERSQKPLGYLMSLYNNSILCKDWGRELKCLGRLKKSQQRDDEESKELRRGARDGRWPTPFASVSAPQENAQQRTMPVTVRNLAWWGIKFFGAGS